MPRFYFYSCFARSRRSNLNMFLAYIMTCERESMNKSQLILPRKVWWGLMECGGVECLVCLACREIRIILGPYLGVREAALPLFTASPRSPLFKDVETKACSTCSRRAVSELSRCARIMVSHSGRKPNLKSVWGVWQEPPSPL